ncbi:MAG: AbrB/MazE/SpoVT family DNA-binding domain-containing protein [Thermoleophilia bacterium]|nr:AbrB/MazE/SpoVT family DNA-binding domain-containing protein [Thermoleophilia bacterium]
MHANMNITFFGSNTVGEKGQVVIPIEGRQKLGLNPGDKLIFMGDMDKGVLIVAKAEVFEQHMSEMQASFQFVQEQIKKKG